MGYLRAVLALILAAAFAGCNSTNNNIVPGPSPAPLTSIQHVVILMQENRSFNNMFAGFPGATTAMVGKCLPGHDASKQWCQSGTARLKVVTLESTGNLGLGRDIDHSHHGFEIECHANAKDVCRNDGFSRIHFGESGLQGPAMLYPYRYVKRSETKAYWDFARQYALADRMFFTDTASSFIAHQIILSGSVALNNHESLTDQPPTTPWGCDAKPGLHAPVLFKDGREDPNGPFPCFGYATIADLLDARNVSWKYYVRAENGKYFDFSGQVWNGFDAIAKVRCKTFTPPYDCDGYGADWKPHIMIPNTKVFGDIKNGTLPSISWVIPSLADSDHPASGCQHGPHWVTKVIDAIGESKYWDSTAIILMWDDWGGWYDPVPPPQTNYTSLGFRIPMIVISPWARANTVVHTQYQYGSILRFIEDNFGLGSLNTTDATSTPISDMFDFSQKPIKFVPEALPPQIKCKYGTSSQEIIEHDGGVPE